MSADLALARAVDELRRGRPVRIAGAGGRALTVAAVELADAALLETLEPADLLLTPERAAVLKVANQRPAAGAPAVRIARTPWLDLAALQALADPVRDLATPLKGPFRTLPLGGDAGIAVAAIRLAKRAGLLPALLVAEATPTDTLTIAATDMLAWSRAARLRIVTRARLPLDAAEDSEVVAFRPDDGGPEHLALRLGTRLLERPDAPPPLVRLHSACLTGDVLGSMKCDCGPQLQLALRELAADGGILLYLQQEGRGIGLVNKLRAYALQDQGFDTVDANLRLGFQAEERDFELAAAMLRLIGVPAVRLLTNNPDKVAALEAAGVTVAERVPHRLPPNPHNAQYLETKRLRAGHLL